MKNLVEKGVKRFGRVDVPANNAGVSFEPANYTGESTYIKTIDINAKSLSVGCKYATWQFLKQDLDESRSNGCIVNMESIRGLAGSWGHGTFSLLLLLAISCF